jgi:CRP-like cAMP-binding protein
VFYLQTGRVQLAVVSKTGKEVTIGILNNGSFFGEGSLAWPSSAHEYCNRHDGMLCSPN